MSDDDTKRLLDPYESLPSGSGNITKNKGKGGDAFSSDSSLGSNESKEPWLALSAKNKMKGGHASCSKCPRSTSTEVETSNEEELPTNTSTSYMTDSIEKEVSNEDNTNIRLPSHKRMCRDSSTSDISTTESIEIRNAVENPLYAHIPNYITDATENEDNSNNQLPANRRMCQDTSISDYSTTESIEIRNAVKNPIYQNIPNYVPTATTSTARGDNITSQLANDRIISILNDIVKTQKMMENRLAAIENTISISRDAFTEHFRTLERDHTIIRRNQGALSATMENLGNNLTVFGERVTRERNQ